MDYCIKEESLSNFTLKKFIAQQKFEVKKLRQKVKIIANQGIMAKTRAGAPVPPFIGMGMT